MYGKLPTCLLSDLCNTGWSNLFLITLTRKVHYFCFLCTGTRASFGLCTVTLWTVTSDSPLTTLFTTSAQDSFKLGNLTIVLSHSLLVLPPPPLYGMGPTLHTFYTVDSIVCCYSFPQYCKDSSSLGFPRKSQTFMFSKVDLTKTQPIKLI